METAGETARSVSRGYGFHLQRPDCCIYALGYASRTETGKGGVFAEAGSQCHLLQRPHNPSSCRNLVWWTQQNLRGVAGAGQPVSGPGSLLSASSQLLQASGHSEAPPGSGPKKKSVNRVRQDHRGGGSGGKGWRWKVE